MALLPRDDTITGPAGDVCIRTGSAWKGAASVLASSGIAVNGVNLPNSKGKEHDPVVRVVLKRRGMQLQDMPGFFLNDTVHIMTPLQGTSYP
ncbi:hypothetical protein BKA93DRAFT_830188 [Sparassis latifolia]